MTCFESGFIKYATECGLSETKAAHMFARIAAHPDIVKLSAHREEADKEEKEYSNKPSDLDVLANMLRHELIDSHYSNIKKQIEL
jgi:predicted nucleic acid-binding protein